MFMLRRRKCYRGRDPKKVLFRHPLFHMCAVVGIPDPKWGESRAAVCCPSKPGADG